MRWLEISGRSLPLKWLQVSLQGYPPCLICCRVPVGPRISLISWSEGKQALLSKSSPTAHECQQERWIDSHRVNHNHLGMNCLPCLFTCTYLTAVKNLFNVQIVVLNDCWKTSIGELNEEFFSQLGIFVKELTEGFDKHGLTGSLYPVQPVQILCHLAILMSACSLRGNHMKPKPFFTDQAVGLVLKRRIKETSQASSDAAQRRSHALSD